MTPDSNGQFAHRMQSLNKSKESFSWGVATASAQIEGAAEIDGKGLSTWDQFCKGPGNIYQGHQITRACDHYHRWEEDLDLLQLLGVNAYRFSVSWPRILPRGIGKINELGLSFYERLIDGLLERGITPWITLFHWDACRALEEQGGFLHPDMPHWFGEYTALLAQRFGDRVQHWFTLNEPHAFIEGGLRHGRHAPGKQLPLPEVLLAAHHALLAHAEAVDQLRARVSNAKISAAPVLITAVPTSESKEDREAAREATFVMQNDVLRSSSFWMDPIYGQGYPEEAFRIFGDAMPQVAQTERSKMCRPLDYCGFNLYDAPLVKRGPDGGLEFPSPPPGSPQTAFQWPITEEAHYYGPLFAAERYKLPILITENGLSCRDRIHLDGRVHDPQRIDFIQRHLLELSRAQSAGVDIRGYFHWSLLDNFEWNHGYRERFGLVHVDFASGQRTPKDSFFEYKRIIELAQTP
ncbi:MAG: GH1 family beta-glucosidase [Polyangiaceae bacterium]|nr:GH1 family beta-glucosidase [Polyangiaceae bacterium]